MARNFLETVYILVFCVLFRNSETYPYSINVCDIGEQRNLFNEVDETAFELPIELLTEGYFVRGVPVSFRANLHKLNCPKGSTTVTWEKGENITNGHGVRIKMPDLIISPDEFIRYKMQVYGSNQYCLLKHSERQVEFEVCNITCDENNPCIYKCCEPDEILDIQNFSNPNCKAPAWDLWTPDFVVDENASLSPEESNKIKHVFYVRHPSSFKNKCKLETLTLQDIGNRKRTPFRILKNGSIIIKPDGRIKWKLLTGEKFCVDGSHNFSIDSNYIRRHGEDVSTVLIRCDVEDPAIVSLQKKKKFFDIFYGIVLVICSCFLLATLIVYIVLWKTHNTHIITQLCYMFSLFCAYLFLAVMKFTSVLWTRTNVVSNSCRIIGIFTHFFYLSTFTWLSVINFDIWLTFRILKPASGNKGGLKKLLAYIAFAEGIPFLIVATAVVIDTVYEYDEDSPIVLPQYGRKNCFMDLYFAQLYYLYIPIAILLTSNILFFTFTLYSLYSIRQSTKFATSSSSKTNNPMESLKLFSKLFLIMGIPWILDVISWSTTTEYHDAKWYWVVADIVLLCQSFALFSFFAMKKDICIALETKYPRFKEFKNQVYGAMTNSISLTSCFRKCPCFSSKDYSEVNTASTATSSNSSEQKLI